MIWILTNEVEDISELRHISHGASIGSNERTGANGGGQHELRALRIFLQLLEEREEVVGVVRSVDVATNTILSRVLPATQSRY